MERCPEQILAERLRNRDRTAMKELYGLYSGYLNAVCTRYVADKDSAKDILQDCFVKIFSGIGSFRFRGEGSLKAWMKKIVVNESLKYLRKSARTGLSVDTDILPDIPDDEDPDMDDIPPAVIHEMIRRLPDEKSHREIASMLGIRESSSASQLHRAKAQLARWINEYRKKSDTPILSH